MNEQSIESEVGNIFKVLGQPFRIKILLTIGSGEACVCHLEATLKKKQAYISQHLSALRVTGILETRREGKFIFYKVKEPEVFDLIWYAAMLTDFPPSQIPEVRDPMYSPDCECPNCGNGSDSLQFE
jgi:ArsR family transcriptional regulator